MPRGGENLLRGRCTAEGSIRPRADAGELLHRGPGIPKGMEKVFCLHLYSLIHSQYKYLLSAQDESDIELGGAGNCNEPDKYRLSDLMNLYSRREVRQETSKQISKTFRCHEIHVTE